jgi:high-affinity nickel permease
MSDEDGPMVAKCFYEALMAHEIIDADHVAFALDTAVRKLRESGVPARRWAPFVHIGV